MNKRLVYGVGISNADYQVVKYVTVINEDGKKVRKLAWLCPFYDRWKKMFERCYSAKKQQNHPTYKGCTVCEEWLTFSNFKQWMEQQDWVGKHLDKDILYPGNKVYSPQTCVFVDHRVNSFIPEGASARGQYMIGVSWNKKAKRFQAHCSEGSSKNKCIGLFDTELEAHKAWLDYKLKLAEKLAEEQSDMRVANALIERYTQYEIRI